MAPITQVWQVRLRISPCKPCEMFHSGGCSVHGTASQDLSSAAASCPESTISESSCQPCCQSGTAPSAATVSRLRSSWRASPECRRRFHQKSQLQWARCQATTQITKPQLKKKSQERLPPMNSASKKSTASPATTQFLPHSLGSCACAQHNSQAVESLLSAAPRTPVDGKMASDSAAFEVRSRYKRSPEWLRSPLMTIQK